MDEVTKLKSLMQSKPELFKQLLSENETPKPKKQRSVSHGQLLEVTPNIPVNISLKEAKRIVKANRPPRKPLTEEQKKRALANLAKGRETIRKRRAELLKQTPASVQLQVKSKQTKTVIPQKAAQLPEDNEDEDFIEWKNLKRKAAALQEVKQEMRAQKIVKKGSNSGAFY